MPHAIITHPSDPNFPEEPIFHPKLLRLLNNAVLFKLHRVIVRAFPLALSLFAAARLASNTSLWAEETIGAGQAACYPGGLFCFKSVSETNTQVHLVKYDHG